MKTLTLLLFSIFFYGKAIGKVIYVSEFANGLKTGDSWQNAFSDLSDAIDASRIGDSIWITEGFYTPLKSKDGVFKLKDGVSLFGRFTGTEKSIDDRFSATATILTTEFTSYRYQHKGDVVAEIIDHANSIVLNDITFSYGLKNGVKIENASPTFINCSFEGNGDRSDNTSTGGVYIRGEQKFASPVFKNCQFYHNKGPHGGAVKALGSKAFPYFENCFFSQNTSKSGAAIWTHRASITTIGCLFNKNISDTAGCCHVLQGKLESINCTYIQNTAQFASVCLAESTGFIQLVNAIIWENGAGTSILETKKSLDTIKARYSIIEGGYNGKAILNQNPQFPSQNRYNIDRNSPAFNAGDPKLDLRQLPKTDLVKNNRVRHGHIDIGAYEVECESTEHSEWTRISVKSCGTYVAPSGTAIDSSGLHFDVIPNKVGCDSIILIDLTIQQPTSHVIRKKSCSPIEINGVNYDQSGTYTQTLTNAKGCDSILTIELTIPRLNSDVFVQGRLLKAQMENASYQWINCASNTPIPGATNQSYKVIEDGSYAVEVSNNDCTKRSSCVEIIISDLAEVKNQNFELYPNPFSHVLNVKRKSNQPAEFKISTITGENLISGTLRDRDSQIDLSEIPAGIYMMSIGSTTEYIVKSQ